MQGSVRSNTWAGVDVDERPSNSGKHPNFHWHLPGGCGVPDGKETGRMAINSILNAISKNTHHDGHADHRRAGRANKTNNKESWLKSDAICFRHLSVCWHIPHKLKASMAL